jgi:hypothetical protein
VACLAAAAMAMVFGVAVAPARTAQFSVSTTADSGAGSLRQAILDANGTPGADAIAIGATGTVSLASPLPALSDGVTIDGPAAGGFAVTRGAAAQFRLLSIQPGVDATISRLQLSGGDAGNDASGGGAILNLGTLDLRNVTISQNTAQTRGGGVASLSGRLTIENSTIASNTVAGGNSNFFGGGVYVRASTATITASTISGNSATGMFSGGGGGIGLDANANVTIVNSTISGNQASDRGGGIGGFFGPARVNLTSVTLAGNGEFPLQDVTGANLYLEGAGANASAASFVDTIIGLPLGAGAANCAGQVTLVSLGHNLESANTCDLNQPADLTSVDPRIAPLADNGGPTLTRALQPGSLAIDAGTSAGLSTDQRSVARPQGPASDIGAYELIPQAPAAPSPPPAAPVGPATTTPLTAPKPTLIDAPIRSFWTVTARGTRVLQLLVKKIPGGAAVSVRCKGGGCAFRSKHASVKRGVADLRPLFKTRLLRPGAVIEIRVTAPNRIGKVTRYTIRKGRLPATLQLCLSPGATKPTERC